MALYLLLTMAPFAVVAPFLGPVLDRSRAGRRLMLIAGAGSRALICLSMAGHLQSLWLFPEAFGVLVLSKAHMVTKSALVPTTVADEGELVTANSRLAVLSVLAGFAAAIPGVIVLKVGFLGGPWVVRLAAVVFAAAAVAAVRIPKPPRAGGRGPPPAKADEELHAITIRMAATGMAVLRAAVGFLTFFVAFAFRAPGAPSWWFGVVLAASLVGTLVGNVAAPPLRRILTEERILLGVAGCWWRWWASSPAAPTAWPPSAWWRPPPAWPRPRPSSPSTASCSGTPPTPSGAARSPASRPGSSWCGWRAPSSRWSLDISTGFGIDIIALGCGLAFFSYLGGIVSAKHRRALHQPARPAGADAGSEPAVTPRRSGRSIRASQRPGASSSAGVGSSRSDFHSRARPSSPARSTTPAHERLALLVLGRPELQAEEALGEAGALGRLHPPPAEGLGDPPVGAHQPVADGVEDVVDVAGDGRQQGLDATGHLPLGGRLDDAEQRLRAEGLGEGGRVGGVDVGEAALEGVGVDVELADVVVDQRPPAGPGRGAGPAPRGG